MKLQLTNGYPPQFDQISRILQLLQDREGKKQISRHEAAPELGISEEKLKRFTTMMIGFGLVKPRVLSLTNFGQTVNLRDPYFDKLETLWIMHYIVSIKTEWVVWHRMVNLILPMQESFEVGKVSDKYFLDLSTHFTARTLREKLPSEIGAVLATYSRSNFARLGLLKQEGTGTFVKTNPVDVPDLAFLYCLLHYRDEHALGSSAINIEDAALAEYSPGRVLNLPEYRVRSILGNLHNAELVRLEQLANLDQVRLPQSLSTAVVLNKIYGENNAN